MQRNLYLHYEKSRWKYAVIATWKIATTPPKDGFRTEFTQWSRTFFYVAAKWTFKTLSLPFEVTSEVCNKNFSFLTKNHIGSAAVKHMVQQCSACTFKHATCGMIVKPPFPWWSHCWDPLGFVGFISHLTEYWSYIIYCWVWVWGFCLFATSHIGPVTWRWVAPLRVSRVSSVFHMDALWVVLSTYSATANFYRIPVSHSYCCSGTTCSYSIRPLFSVDLRTLFSTAPPSPLWWRRARSPVFSPMKLRLRLWLKSSPHSLTPRLLLADSLMLLPILSTWPRCKPLEHRLHKQPWSLWRIRRRPHLVY